VLTHIFFGLLQGPDAIDHITGQKCVRCIVHPGDYEGASMYTIRKDINDWIDPSLDPGKGPSNGAGNAPPPPLLT